MSHDEFKSSEPIEPQEASPMKHEMTVLGIDRAKRVFHAAGMDDTGKIVLRKRLSRHDLMPFLAKLPAVRIGIEACGGAHDWARRFREHGHEVKLMAPQFVKPYVKTNKNDSRDAGSCPCSLRLNTRGLPGDRHWSKKVHSIAPSWHLRCPLPSGDAFAAGCADARHLRRPTALTASRHGGVHTLPTKLPTFW
jgi:hypothetical protein